MAKENKNYIRGSNKEDNYKYCPNHISGVYIIINDITKHFYIGSSINVNRRLSHQFGCLKRGVNPCDRLQENFDQYGYENFSFYILYKHDSESFIRKKEMELLVDNHENDLLLNTTTENNTWVHDRNRLKVSSYKKKISELGKTRIGKANSFYGKSHTEKTKKKLSELHKGKDNPNCHRSVVADGKFYKSIKSVMSEYSIKQSTAYYRLESKNYTNWEKL